MCGIAGIARAGPSGVSTDALERMATALRHRGPDGSGVWANRRVGLAHTRLSIIDLAGGAQPLGNEDDQVLVTYNGEIYNYLELREELAALGHRFRTRSDTEVLVHGYEEWGTAIVERLNGQFAFAIYDRRTERVMLARDRFGVRPLLYAFAGADLVFASEAKALFASGEVDAAPDLESLDEVFTFWACRAPRTPFRGVAALEPGCVAMWERGVLRLHRYYDPSFSAVRIEPADVLERLDALMHDGVSMRMRADVPVGGYLSGGLDSAITSALAARMTPHDLRTFSVTFADPRFDESPSQRLMAERLGSRHASQHIDGDEIARVFPAVVRHAETPLVRTAPAPMFLLSRLTRERGIKVVLTGEGADELFLGYDLFKETAVRLFCLRQPGSQMRPRLFDRLYPYLTQGVRGRDFWRRFFLGAGSPDDPLFSHLPRWSLTSRIKEFYSPETRAALAGADPMQRLRDTLPPEFGAWSPLHRAAYLEIKTLLEPYLLSSQGDRMALAHGVEGRFPFLDHRLFELAAALPEQSKMRGLREKDVLRRWAARFLPAAVADRPKQPYRAPDAPAFFGPRHPEYVRELLDAPAVARTGIFAPAAVAALVRRCESGLATGAAENQALVAVLSTQLWHQEFFAARPPDAVALPPARRVRAPELTS